MKTVEIKKEQIFLDGKLIFEKKESSFVPFIKETYKVFELKYPKFHKMDRLCKLAFVAANLLLEKNELDGYEAADIAIIMANAHSTLHTDKKHCDTIKDKENYYPSPKNFVYTLPNIMVGEICIKYNIKGESLFLVSNEPNNELLNTYAQDLLDDGLAKICLTGWVDYTEKNYCAKLAIIK